MHCQRCGYTLQPGEVFCGQCGSPRLTPAAIHQQHHHLFPSSGNSLPGLPGLSSIPQHMVSGPLSGPISVPLPRFQGNPSGAGSIVPPQHYLSAAPHNPQTNWIDISQQKNPSQRRGNGPNAQTNPSQQAFPGFAHTHANLQFSQPAISNPGTLARSYRLPQAIEPAAYPQTMPVRAATTPPKKARSPQTTMAISIGICSLIAIISIISLITSTLSGQASPAPEQNNHTPQPTEQVPVPDIGFAWCNTPCTTYGFTAQYPTGWQQGNAPRGNGIQFSRSDQPDQLASISTLGLTDKSASAILSDELQMSFASRSNYTAPSAFEVSTVGGETWINTRVTYQGTTRQQVNVMIFVTVHQGKGYVIELQAPNPTGQEFNISYSTYYAPMLNRFQFS
jgi:hypothetical protein